MKRIATVQDISCLGKCSLTVALPIISAMGVECAIVPTAVLSTHTMFQGFTFCDLTGEIEKISAHWKREGFAFDALYTGYLGSLEQIDLMKKFFADFKNANTLCVVDPCMADDGKLYPGFTETFAKKMASLVAIADVALPNLTEASFLLSMPYKKTGEYDEEYVKKILLSISELGAKKVVLKGVQFTSDQETVKNVAGKIGIASYDSETKKFAWYFHTKQPELFHGTGDIFASVFTGSMMRGLSFEKSYALAGDFVERAIAETLSHSPHNKYGVDFESTIPYLIGRL